MMCIPSIVADPPIVEVKINLHQIIPIEPVMMNTTIGTAIDITISPLWCRNQRRARILRSRAASNLSTLSTFRTAFLETNPIELSTTIQLFFLRYSLYP